MLPIPMVFSLYVPPAKYIDPLAADVAQQWKENEANAIATGILYLYSGGTDCVAREWTRLYASPA